MQKGPSEPTSDVSVLIAKAAQISLQQDPSEYKKLSAEFKPLFINKRSSESVLRRIKFVIENSEELKEPVKQDKSIEFASLESKRLYECISLMHFALEEIIPLERSFLQYKLLFHYYIFDNVSKMFSHMFSIFTKDQSHECNNLETYRMFFCIRRFVDELYYPYYSQFEVRLLNNQTPELSKENIETEKKRFLDNQLRFVQINLYNAQISYLVGDIENGKRYQEQTGALLDYLNSNLHTVANFLSVPTKYIQGKLAKTFVAQQKFLTEMNSQQKEIRHALYLALNHLGDLSKTLDSVFDYLLQEPNVQDKCGNQANALQVQRLLASAADFLRPNNASSVHFFTAWTGEEMKRLCHGLVILKELNHEELLACLPQIGNIFLSWRQYFAKNTTLLPCRILADYLINLANDVFQCLKIIELRNEPAKKEAIPPITVHQDAQGTPKKARRRVKKNEFHLAETVKREESGQNAPEVIREVQEIAQKELEREAESCPKLPATINEPQQAEINLVEVEQEKLRQKRLRELRRNEEKAKGKRDNNARVHEIPEVILGQALTEIDIHEAPVEPSERQRNEEEVKKQLALDEERKKEALAKEQAEEQRKAALLGKAEHDLVEKKRVENLAKQKAAEEAVLLKLLRAQTLEIANIEMARVKKEKEDKAIAETSKVPVNQRELCYVFNALSVNSIYKIVNPDLINSILHALNACGYWAYVVGGAVRDPLLGLTPNDYDLITNCPINELPDYCKKNCVLNNYIPGLFNIITGPLKVQLLCTSLSLKEELQRRDVTINTLIADANGIVYDVLEVISHLKDRYLHFLGDINARLEDDPKKIFRMIIMATRFNKRFQQFHTSAIYNHAHLITEKLSFGAYVDKMKSLFLKGKSYANYKKILFLKILPFLTLSSSRFNIDLNYYCLFLEKTLREMDLFSQEFRESNFNVCDILSLFLLPELIESVRIKKLPVMAAIDTATDLFQSRFKGNFLAREKVFFAEDMKIKFLHYYKMYITELTQHQLLVQSQGQGVSSNPLLVSYYMTQARNPAPSIIAEVPIPLRMAKYS